LRLTERQRSLHNIISIDVEEYFHPSEACASVRFEDWSDLPSRVGDQTSWILDLFDQHEVKGTFFILGWVAHRNPALIRQIASRGHEIGCHSYAHRLVYELSPEAFRADTLQAVKAISDATGITPMSYRAPSYSITGKSLWALEILVQSGFTYDSSIYPISHDRYGMPGSERHAHTLWTDSGPICEVPIATVQVSGSVAPVGGGGYLRMLPYLYTAAGIRRINAEGQPACIYLHPWEIDPEQPRIVNGMIARARTYTGLRGMGGKLARLLADFRFAPMTQVHPGLNTAVRSAHTE
jgi:polysaccharide deacetylase family protein (PEP-CTERM system associated)